MWLKKLVFEIRRTKIPYYIKNYFSGIIPLSYYVKKFNIKLASDETNIDKNYLTYRLNYYNKLSRPCEIGTVSIALSELPLFKSPKCYSFDTFEYSKYFAPNLRANFLFGDITYVPEVPTIQKSRPICGENSNAVLLKLDKKRHFLFVKDSIAFKDKKNMLVGRGVISQPHRIKFMEMYFDNSLCDLGQVNAKGGKDIWIKPKMHILDHLKYKFILSLEGNDVATNLKWIMSSNSIAVMPRPKYETWFMEGELIPDFHYILINDDFSNLEQKLQYYIANVEEAESIVKNANSYVQQFRNRKQEDLLSILVLHKYFYCTSQID